MWGCSRGPPALAARSRRTLRSGAIPSIICTRHWRRRQQALPLPLNRRRLPPCRLPQDLQAQGVEVLLPVGCSDFDEWLLDALSAERLLKQLRGPTKPAKLDLINACVSASTGPLAMGRRESWQTPPRVGRDSMGHGGEEVPLVDIRSLLHADSSGTPGETQQAAAPAGPDGEGEDGAPQLRLRSLQVGA